MLLVVDDPDGSSGRGRCRRDGIVPGDKRAQLAARPDHPTHSPTSGRSACLWDLAPELKRRAKIEAEQQPRNNS